MDIVRISPGPAKGSGIPALFHRMRRGDGGEMDVEAIYLRGIGRMERLLGHDGESRDTERLIWSHIEVGANISASEISADAVSGGGQNKTLCANDDETKTCRELPLDPCSSRR